MFELAEGDRGFAHLESGYAYRVLWGFVVVHVGIALWAVSRERRLAEKNAYFVFFLHLGGHFARTHLETASRYVYELQACEIGEFSSLRQPGSQTQK